MTEHRGCVSTARACAFILLSPVLPLRKAAPSPSSPPAGSSCVRGRLRLVTGLVVARGAELSGPEGQAEIMLKAQQGSRPGV